jgi:hypothetical protein
LQIPFYALLFIFTHDNEFPPADAFHLPESRIYQCNIDKDKMQVRGMPDYETGRSGLF